MAFFLLAASGKEIKAATAPAPAATNSWRSALYPETGYAPSEANLETDKVLQDFSYAGYHGGAASIPDVAGPVFDATCAPYGADPTGATDSTDAIQAAIDAAGQAGGGVVFLPPGTYHLSVPSDRHHALLMNRPGVVLRGAGRDRTFLLNTTYSGMRSKVVIRVAGPHEAAFKAVGTAQSPLSRNLLNSTCVIPVASASSFQAGDTVVIRNDITDDWLNERGEPDWLGQNANLGGLTYRRTVTAVDAAAGTITVDAPTRYVLKLRDNARVVRLALPPLAEVGLEDFAIGNVENPGTEWEQSDNSIPGKPSYEVCGSFLLMLERTRDCWVRRLSTFQAEGNTSTSHLLSSCLDVRESTHVTVDDCSFQRPQCGGNGGNGYMFRLYHSGECLVQHSQAQHSRHGFMIGGIGASGNVIHDCTDTTTGHACGATGSHATSGRSNDFHECFSQACLVDVCTGDDSFWEAAYRGGKGANPHHNLTATHCVYWNTNGEGTLKEALVQSEQAGYGYVIGTRGPRSRVELPRLFPSATDPVDHVEGEGEGDTLVPFSLFEDQVRRRLGSAGPPKQDAAEAFAAKTIKDGDFSLNYRIYAPQGLAPDEKIPLILFLHGSGERGLDNLGQLRHGIPSLLSYILKKNTPAIIIVPQCPPDMQWVDVPWGDDAHTMPPSPSQPMQAVMALLTQCLAELPVDLSRVYITGISMGGFGTWDFLQRKAPLFAAGIPICGGGDTAEAAKLIKTPIWAFHGGSDTTVKTQRSRDMAEAIKQAGGSRIQYTEYPGWEHNSWTSTYANDKVFDWLFEQKKL